SLLDELESSVPSPVPAITVNQGEMSSPQRVTSTQQQTRISASSATRELDELMASLSDFKVVFPPGSPIPLRRTISVLASPSVPLLQHRTDAAASSSSPLPSLLASSPLGPSAYTCGSSGVQSAGEEPHDEGVQGPALPIPAPHTMRSVGCQTDEDPLFPPMQIQGLEQRADGERCWAAGWPRDGGRSSPGGQDEGGFMAQGKTGSSS
ncbi:paxillin, partial [Homo sapiens]